MEGLGSSCCVLEVDVNGQETFLVDMCFWNDFRSPPSVAERPFLFPTDSQEVVSSFSGRFARLFGAKSMRNSGKVKVIFHDFPGEAEGFELMSIFCYNNGKVRITPDNVVLLNLVAHYMQMEDDETSCMTPNLVHQTETSLRGISYWSWSELSSALKQCQDLFPATDSSFVSRKITESIAERLSLPNIAASCTSSSDSSSYRLSIDTRSTESRRTDCLGSKSWWFEDLVILNVDWIKRIVKMMLSEEFNHAVITRFLIYYQKSRFVGATPFQKCGIIESIIDLLPLLDQSSLSWKCLSEVFRVGSGLNIRTSHRILLERLMGSRLDQASPDHLLFPSPSGKRYAYDVDLVVRLIEAFLGEGRSSLSPDRLIKVGHLLDSFLVEVASDVDLKPLKFESLVTILPDAARKLQDLLYQSIDLYFEVHNHLTEEQKLGIYRVLNHEKLSAAARKHFAENTNFPSDFRANALQLFNKSSYYGLKARKYEQATGAHLQGLHRRILELEKLYKIMQTQMANLVKPQKMSGHSCDSYLPKLCSS
ncbi:hypothetical protein CRG98_006656 [Punica granatum]|uniref:NPH3 domain-containing protein n=1 Tax=Punica granatum TaxID=22663 RepID=A0A2I0KYP1_PUNGR|nr:hypothetical protein CRG98_006656 [Punica granatum]